MPTEKIRDLHEPCRDPDHEPSKYVVREPGVYRHTCSGCGAVRVFTVDAPKLAAPPRPMTREDAEAIQADPNTSAEVREILSKAGTAGAFRTRR